MFFGDEATARRRGRPDPVAAAADRRHGVRGHPRPAWASTAPRSRPATGRTPAAAATPAARKPTAEAVAEITLEEAFHGTTRLVEVDGKRLEITIPRGADTGTRIKLTGQGPGGGDLVVVVTRPPDPAFTRRGADLERELPLDARGGPARRRRSPSRRSRARVLLTIPAGTQHGRTFRLHGPGHAALQGDGHGDLLRQGPGRPARPTCPTRRRRPPATFLDLVDQPDPR